MTDEPAQTPAPIPEVTMLTDILNLKFPPKEGKQHVVTVKSADTISLKPAAGTPLLAVRNYFRENNFEVKLTEEGTIEMGETNSMIFPSSLVNLHRIVANPPGPDDPGQSGSLGRGGGRQ